MKNLLSAVLLCAMILAGGCVSTENGRGQRIGSEGVSLKQYRNRAIGIIEGNLNHSNEILRVNGIEVAVSTKLTELMPRIVRMTKDESPAVRFACAMAIGDMEYRSGELAASGLRKDENKNVQLAAEFAIMKLGRGGAGAIVMALESKDQMERANAAMLLGKIGNKNAIKSLYGILQDQDSMMGVKIQAAEAIAMLGENSVYQRLWTLLISKYVDDRIAGIRGMAMLTTTEAREAMMTMLHDDVAEVRLYAAERLGNAGDYSGEYVVLDYFRSPQGRKGVMSVDSGNEMAAMAVGKIGSGELKGYLVDFMSSRSKRISLRAAESVVLLTNRK